MDCGFRVNMDTLSLMRFLFLSTGMRVLLAVSFASTILSLRVKLALSFLWGLVQWQALIVVYARFLIRKRSSTTSVGKRGRHRNALNAHCYWLSRSKGFNERVYAASFRIIGCGQE